jgi:broad specificity phosphatase PhoE
VSRIHLLRHAQPDYEAIEARGLDFRSRDTAALSRAGRQQAHEAAAVLERLGLSEIVSSPMTRTLQTAAIIALRLRLPLTVDIDLREWESGISATETHAGWQRATQQFRDHHGVPQAGARWEGAEQIRERATAALARLPRDGAAVLVVTHAFVIEALTGVDGRAVGFCEHVPFPDGGRSR